MARSFEGIILLTKGRLSNIIIHHTVAGQPTSLKTVISGSNTTHVNVCVSWESPGGDVSGYMIYYQTEGGPVISDNVSGGERETHSLDGLQRGVTYCISTLALSQHLPSPLVGPVSVNTGTILRLSTWALLFSLAGNSSEFVNTTERCITQAEMNESLITITVLATSPSPQLTPTLHPTIIVTTYHHASDVNSTLVCSHVVGKYILT